MMSFKKTFPALVLGLSLAAGCDTLGLGGNDKNDSGTTRDDRISRDRSTRERGYEMKYPADYDHGVPNGARLVREVDADGHVTFTAPHSGRLYVYDVDDRRVAWDGEIRDGDALRFDSRDDRASLNNRDINMRLDRNHRYRLYVMEDSSSNSSRSSSDRYDSQR